MTIKVVGTGLGVLDDLVHEAIPNIIIEIKHNVVIIGLLLALLYVFIIYAVSC
jgi:hypothetical protein